ncbi:MAG: MerR family transcriptional regulator [bacterium]
MTTPVKIPKRAAYKAADVCSIVELQPYVLRTWEAEFPDLGVQQNNGRARIYRRSDLDKVLRIKELIVVEGLTLGAARRKLAKEASPDDESEPRLFDIEDADETRTRIEEVKSGLRAVLELLGEPGNGGVAASDLVVEANTQAAAPTTAPEPKKKRAAGARPSSPKTKTAKKRA